LNLWQGDGEESYLVYKSLQREISNRQR
jgi:hypothetical protein